MKTIFKNGAFLFLRLIIVTLMSLIVTVSIGVLTTAAFTKNIGYTAFVTDSEGKKIDTYHFENTDGVDKKAELYSEKGYTVNKVTERSKLEGKGAVLNNVLSQLISIIILGVFIYNKLFPMGNSDSNLAHFNHIKGDKLKGLKIGLVAIIPGIVLFLVSVLFALGLKKEMTIAIYTLPNFYVFQLIKAIIGNATTLGDLSAVRLIFMVLPIMVVPIISYISYMLGFKDIMLFEKLVYKKKKKVK